MIRFYEGCMTVLDKSLSIRLEQVEPEMLPNSCKIANKVKNNVFSKLCFVLGVNFEKRIHEY